ncbi:MAG: DUF1573 domain-containing protein [Alistipes sp.]
MLRVISLFLLLTATFFTACHSPQVTTSRAGQLITVSDSMLIMGGADTLHFGHLSAGEVATKTLRLRNASSQHLVILSHKTGCGCVSLDYDRQPIAPTTERSLSVLFDSNGEEGWQWKVVEIKLSGAAKPLKIYIEAEVE